MGSAHPAVLRPPPGDLDQRTLPMTSVSGPLFRVHAATNAALFFSKDDEKRFSGSNSPYGVCYCALSPLGAFAETCVEEIGNQTYAATGGLIDTRACSRIVVSYSVNVVDLTAANLLSIGAAHVISTTEHYNLTQQWAAAFYTHPSQPAGILYQSNLAGTEVCVALFDRALKALRPGPARPFSKSDLDGFLSTLQIALIP
jgi:RES domain